MNIDNKLDADVLTQAGLNVPFVGPDNRAGARKVGEALAKQLQPGDKVAIIEGIPTAFNGQQRRLGFEDAMKAAGVNIVSVQSGRWEMDNGQQRRRRDAQCPCGPQGHSVRERQHGPGRGVRHSGGGQDRAGAGRGLRQHQRACGRCWTKGQVVATADQHGDQLAVFGIEAALKILKGAAPPADQTTAVDLVIK